MLKCTCINTYTGIRALSLREHYLYGLQDGGISEEVKSTDDIQLQSNEAYGPIQMADIHTSPNTAYVLQKEGLSEEVKGTHSVQLQSNEAYGSIHVESIHTSPNIAYGPVHAQL